MSRSGEFEMIARFFAPLAATYRGALKLTDDAAIIDTSDGLDRVVTSDAMIEGVHFLKSDPPRRAARKALRVNLSDLAAMGAVPEAYTLVLQVPQDYDDDWIGEIAQGLKEDQAQFGIALIGGDTVSADAPAVLSITAIGKIEPGRALRRSGAGAGDDIYVTGTIGDAKLGLDILREAAGTQLRETDRQAAIDRYQLPEPRTAVGETLVGVASACIDVSDGLVADAHHLAEESGLQARLALHKVPWSSAVDSSPDYPEKARVIAGDDYELLFTAPAGRRDAVAGVARDTGVRVTRIGRMSRGDGVLVVDDAGDPVTFERTGYQHR